MRIFKRRIVVLDVGDSDVMGLTPAPRGDARAASDLAGYLQKHAVPRCVWEGHVDSRDRRGLCNVSKSAWLVIDNPLVPAAERGIWRVMRGTRRQARRTGSGRALAASHREAIVGRLLSPCASWPA